VTPGATGGAHGLPWPDCTNVRDLGGQPLHAGGVTTFGVILRGDNVRNLTEVGRRALVDYGVRRVVDLRWQEELDEDSAADMPVEVVHVPLLGLHRPESRYVRFAQIAAEVEDEAAFVRRLYGEYLEEFPDRIAAAVDAVASAPGPVLFHCTAGKDRTGIVAALVLRLAGVGIDAIAADYALTDVRALLQRGLVDGMSEEEVRARRFLLSAPRDGVLALLRDVDDRYGSAACYLEQAGLDPAGARELKRRLAPGSPW
jgi:protein-tyrosine phosphatase